MTNLRYCLIASTAFWTWQGLAHAELITSGVALENGIAPAAGNQPRAADVLTAATRLFEQGDVDACRTRLEEARRLAPVLPPAQIMLGRMHLMSGGTGPALALFNEAALAHADHPDVSLACAELAMAQQRWEDARLHLERTLALPAPSAWPAAQTKRLITLCRTLLTDVWLNQGRYEAAQRMLAELISEGHGNAELLQNSGITLVHLGRIESGMTSLREAKTLDASLLPPELTVAGILASNDPKVDVERYLSAALDRYPDDERVPVEYGAWHVVNDRPEAALEVLRPATGRFPGSFAAHLHAGQALFQLGDFDAAEPFLERAFLLNPANPVAVEHLCLCLLEQPEPGEHLRAVRLADVRFVGREPLADSSAAVLAWARVRNGDARAADRLLTNDPEERLNGPIADYLRGRVLEMRDVDAEAQAAYRLSSESSQWHLCRADAQVRRARD